MIRFNHREDRNRDPFYPDTWWQADRFSEQLEDYAVHMEEDWVRRMKKKGKGGAALRHSPRVYELYYEHALKFPEYVYSWLERYEPDPDQGLEEYRERHGK